MKQLSTFRNIFTYNTSPILIHRRSVQKSVATQNLYDWEAKLLNLKKALNTKMDIQNIIHIEKCMKDIDGFITQTKQIYNDSKENEMNLKTLQLENDSLTKQMQQMKHRESNEKDENMQSDSESKENELAHTKSNLANLLRDLIDLESKFKRMKIGIALMSCMTFASLIYGYNYRQKYSQIYAQWKTLEKSIENGSFYRAVIVP